MAKILFNWELGLGYGHLTPYLPLIKRLRAQQHEVVFVSRDVANAETVFADLGVNILQAPILMHKMNNRYNPQYSYAHLMHNMGFADVRGLFGLVKAWHHVFHYVKPDVALFDHSPIALLAAKSFSFKRIISGSGFLVPPPGEPLPMMRYWQHYDQEQLAKEEGRVLANSNQVLKALNTPALPCLAELFAADRQFMLSFEELDHYPNRPNGNYLGMFSAPGHGIAPVWPEGFTRKVFAYIHAHKSTEHLLATLAQGKFASLIYAPELPNGIKQKYQSHNIAFSSQPLDLVQVAADCDIAITNCTFATTCHFLLHGVPVLVTPTNLERYMLARRLKELGVCTSALANKPEELRPALRALFLSDKYRRAAKEFAERNKDKDLNWQTEKMLGDIENLVPAVEKKTTKANTAKKKKIGKSAGSKKASKKTKAKPRKKKKSAA